MNCNSSTIIRPKIEAVQKQKYLHWYSYSLRCGLHTVCEYNRIEMYWTFFDVSIHDVTGVKIKNILLLAFFFFVSLNNNIVALQLLRQFIDWCLYQNKYILSWHIHKYHIIKFYHRESEGSDKHPKHLSYVATVTSYNYV